jgi:hypothetical protein
MQWSTIHASILRNLHKVKQNFERVAFRYPAPQKREQAYPEIRHTFITLEHSHAYKLPRLNLFRRYLFGYLRDFTLFRSTYLDNL